MSGLSEGLVYLDEHMVVLDKPAGLLSVPGRGADRQDCLSARAQALWPDALIVHRLDMATSGLVVFARGAEAQRQLSMAFQDRSVVKGYVAVVEGRLSGSGRIELPIGADWSERPKRRIDEVNGKPSLTLWRVEESPHPNPLPQAGEGAKRLAREFLPLPLAGEGRGEGALMPAQRHSLPLPLAGEGRGEGQRTRLHLQPVTGRTHQLRVHLAAFGHPILGDTLYAPPGAQSRAPRLLLHASRLELIHPILLERMSFDSVVPF